MYGSIMCRWDPGQGGTPWVARLVGLDDTYGFKREFIRGVIDRTYARDKVGRGTRYYFAVPPGLYDVYESISRSKCRRYFVQVDDMGDVTEIEREEVVECLKNNTLL